MFKNWRLKKLEQPQHSSTDTDKYARKDNYVYTVC